MVRLLGAPSCWVERSGVEAHLTCQHSCGVLKARMAGCLLSRGVLLRDSSEPLATVRLDHWDASRDCVARHSDT
jgi:hypothetical protein